MKYLFAGILMGIVVGGNAQTIIGTWQQVDVGTCLQSEFKESKTEQELLPSMGDSRTAVAKLITFDAKGRGKEGVFSKGVRKGASLNDFEYKLTGSELQIMDKKSGIMTQSFVIDSLSATTLMIHNALKDCEARTFSRVK
jgi:hypothetical protein